MTYLEVECSDEESHGVAHVPHADQAVTQNR